MRKIGLIGGLSWYSTQTYYEHIQHGVQARVGKQASAPIVIDSLESDCSASHAERAVEWILG